MPTRSSKPPRDVNQLAKSIVDQATGDAAPAPVTSKKQESGRKGGIRGGRVRAATVAPERRKEIAKNAAIKRWSKKATAEA